MIHSKYPKTFHLPWSPGATNDDKVLPNIDAFKGKQVIASEKMDGENFNLYRSGLHARSTSGAHHVSQSWIRQFHARIKHNIPTNIRICGEYLYAQHSIKYSALPSYFLVFGVFQDENCLRWEDTVKFCIDLKLSMVPVLYSGTWDESAIKKCWTGTSRYGGEQEGYVVRVVDGCPTDDYQQQIAKYVRPNHVQPQEKHWAQKLVIANKLNPDFS